MTSFSYFTARQLEFNARITAAAERYMRDTYGDADRMAPDMIKRWALACEGAARELARTGALADLDIERPAQIHKLQVEAGLVEIEGEPPRVVTRFDYTGTVLETPVRWANLDGIVHIAGAEDCPGCPLSSAPRDKCRRPGCGGRRHDQAIWGGIMDVCERCPVDAGYWHECPPPAHDCGVIDS